jgi:thymidylate kinase
MTPLCRKIVAMRLITFEGSEDCEKPTQVKRLAARWKRWGIRPAVLGSQVGSAIGEAIRNLLQHSEDNHAITPETELLPDLGKDQTSNIKLQTS